MSDHEVTVEIAKTIMEDAYEPLRISIMLKTGSRPGETATQLFDRVYGFVETRLNDKIAENKDSK